MRKVYLFFFAVLFSAGVLWGQLPPKYYWRLIPSPVSSNWKTYWNNFITGENGTMLYYDNYLRQFQQIPSFTSYNINDIFGTLNGLITAVGNNGIIFYQNSNGSTWSQQTSGTNADLYSVSLVLKFNPYPTILFVRIAVGSGGTILKSTTTSPINWTPWTIVQSNTLQNLNSVFLDSNVSFIVGNNGTILRSTDCGAGWTAVNTGYSNNFHSVYIMRDNYQKCWITGDNGLILKSTNAGLNWTQVPSGTTANLKSFHSVGSGFSYGKYIICGTNGTALVSRDSGSTWSISQTNVNADLNSTDDSYIVGNSGTILRWDVDSSYYFKKLEGNNISSFFTTFGAFNININQSNTPGFQWPKGSGKYAIYSSGLTIAAKVQGELRQTSVSFSGEMLAGAISGGIPFTNDTFKVYSVKRGDSYTSSTDWLNWGLMVPYGAPFVDVNSNGLYEPQIDTPGVKNSSATVFACLTDGFVNSHFQDEGFGGGTLPLYNEVHLTAWSYSQLSYSDMQFVRFDVINKGNLPWTNTYFTFFADTDIGHAEDDYMGCDTVRKLGFGYNADNEDAIYGLNPPAAGILLLKGAYSKYINQGEIGFTSFTRFGSDYLCYPCEVEPENVYHAYNYMIGYKLDSTAWLDPTQSPKKKTKFIYPGDPETNTGWTEYKGSVRNCFRDTTGQILTINPSGERSFNLSSGSDYLTVMPGDTQKIVICQLIARGSSNLNSVTKLKQLADIATEFYNTNFIIGVNNISTEIPDNFSLSQNYPNPFNSMTNIKFKVASSKLIKLVVYDLLGREIKTLVNEMLQPGDYSVRFDAVDLPSGVYFYRLKAGDFSETKKMVLTK